MTPPWKGRRARDSEQDWLLDKENRLGVTHCDIGAYLLHQWKFQPFMADAVLYHHESKSMISSALPLVRIVHAANLLSQGSAEEEEQGAEVAEEWFGFQEDEILDFLLQTDEETKQVAQSLQIEIEQSKKPSQPFSENDLVKQKDLAGTVERLSLLFGTLRNFLEAEDLEDLLKSMHQGLRILFEADRCIFFLLDSEKDCLVGKSVAQDRYLANINGLLIPMHMEKSLLVSSLLQKRPLDSFRSKPHREPVILDKQIIGFLGKEGIFCLPMFLAGEPLGVIVIGLDQVGFSHLSQQSDLLNLFSNQAAAALHMEHLQTKPVIHHSVRTAEGLFCPVPQSGPRSKHPLEHHQELSYGGEKETAGKPRRAMKNSW